MLERRPDMSASDWSDEDGRRVSATFVGWERFGKRGACSDAVVDRLVAAVFGKTPHVEIHNVVRSIERCDTCGGVVYLTAAGLFLIARTDAEQAHARSLLASADEDWDVLGHSEFWVQKAPGEYFVAPTLILHLIAEHGYAPPGEFVQALLSR